MARLPSKEEILAWIADNPAQTSKRDIAKAFGIKGAERIDLKRILKALEEDGHLAKRRKTYRDPDKLPPVSVLQVTEPSPDGDLFARPLEWQGDGPEPTVLLILREADPALGAGDRILARLQEVKNEEHAYEGRLIRRIGTNPRKVLGVFRKTAEGGRILPIDKGTSREWRVPPGAVHGAKDGELVEAEQSGPKDSLGLPRARVITRLGDPSQPKAVSLIAIHQHSLRDDFPDEVMAEADAMEPAGLDGRTDLTEMPLVTIDPADARDHDDAVYAGPDPDPKNAGGFILWVAIADVAHYVTPGSALDREAWARGNSTYFPDRVVPMLPDRLSGDLCSLHEGVARACMVARMVIDAKGQLLSHSFQRGLMRSAASLNYEEVQAAIDGAPNAKTEPLLEPVLKPLYAAYAALTNARNKREPLELDLPERRVELDDDGTIRSVAVKERLDAHRLIEEFMVLANVAAAEALIKKKSPLLFRVHEEPAPEKLENLREVAQAAGMVLAKGQVLKTAQLNRLLDHAKEAEDGELINLAVLRSMTQAYYSPDNFGHFGLALKAYSHFTSPIRRYADLVVHRALIAANGFGDDGLRLEEIERLRSTAENISMTERRSMEAERDTNDRYLAAYLADRVGTELTGRISGVQRFGAFVRLDETGADGLLPVRELGREFFHYDRDSQTLMGSETGVEIGPGQRVLVRLAEAVPVTGGLILELLELNGEPLRSGNRKRGKGPVRRKAKASAKKKRKVTRRRR
ncbi:MAG: ribonuclease R [Pseudomonadota bacterium]